MDHLSFIDKTRYVIGHMSVEPLIILYTIGWTVSAQTMRNLNLDKACRVNLGLNNSVCTAFLAKNESWDRYCEELYDLKEMNKTGPDPWKNAVCDTEEAVQNAVTNMETWKTFLQGLIPAIIIPFVGSWIDRHRRRKPAMLFPIFGEILTLCGFLVCTFFFYQLPMEISGLVEAILPAAFGAWMTMLMAVYTYLGDVTTPEARVLRMGVLSVSTNVSAAFGTSLSGILHQLIGYYGVFLLAMSIHSTGLTLGYLMVKEKHEPTCSEKENKSGLIPFFKDLFDIRHIRETVVLIFRKGEHNYRARVILVMIQVMLVMGPWAGEMSVMYNFTRLRFNWNEVNFTIFQTFLMVINLIGTAITVGLFSHRMKMDDALIGVISCVSKILAGFIYAFATETWVFYLAPLVDIANGTSYIALRSMASKLVPPDELGKLNSVFGMAEALVPVLYQPVYNALYNRTRQTLPGAFFLVGGAFTAPAIVIFLWMYGQHKQDAKELEKADCEKKKCDENVALSKKPVTNEIAESSESTAKLVPNIEVSQDLEMKKRNTESLNNDQAFEDVDINEKSLTNEIAESSANSVPSVEGNQDLDIKQRNIESCHSNHAFEDDNKISRL